MAQLSDTKILCGQYDQHEVGASSLRAWCFVLRNQSELEERLFLGSAHDYSFRRAYETDGVLPHDSGPYAAFYADPISQATTSVVLCASTPEEWHVYSLSV